MNILLILVATVIALAFVIYIWFCIDTALSRQPGRVGYTGSGASVCGPALRQVIQTYIPDTKKVTLVEPGAGFAHIACFLAKQYEWKEVVALEISPFSHLTGRFLNLFRRAPVQFVQGNVFGYPYPKGSFVYSYLSTPIIGKLYADGSLNGCLVASLTFAIPGVTPNQELSVPGWQKRILVYDFRDTKTASQKASGTEVMG